jgi:hypothetical protein
MTQELGGPFVLNELISDVPIDADDTNSPRTGKATPTGNNSAIECLSAAGRRSQSRNPRQVLD